MSFWSKIGPSHEACLAVHVFQRIPGEEGCTLHNLLLEALDFERESNPDKPVGAGPLLLSAFTSLPGIPKSIEARITPESVRVTFGSANP